MMSAERKFTLAAAWTLLGLAIGSAMLPSARADERCPLCEWQSTGAPLFSRIPGLAQLFPLEPAPTGSENTCQHAAGEPERIGVDFNFELLPFDWTGACGVAAGHCVAKPVHSAAVSRRGEPVVWFFESGGDEDSECCQEKCCQHTCACVEGTACKAAPSGKEASASACAEGSACQAASKVSACENACPAHCLAQTDAAPCQESCEDIAAKLVPGPLSFSAACCDVTGTCCPAARTGKHDAAEASAVMSSHARCCDLATENVALRVMLDARDELVAARAEMMEEMLNLMAEKVLAETRLAMAERLIAERERTARELYELKSENLRLQSAVAAVESAHAAEKRQFEIALENERLKLRVAELEKQAAESASRTARRGGEDRKAR